MNNFIDLTADIAEIDLRDRWAHAGELSRQRLHPNVRAEREALLRRLGLDNAPRLEEIQGTVISRGNVAGNNVTIAPQGFMRFVNQDHAVANNYRGQ